MQQIGSREKDPIEQETINVCAAHTLDVWGRRRLALAAKHCMRGVLMQYDKRYVLHSWGASLLNACMTYT